LEPLGEHATAKADVVVVIAHPDDEIFVSGTICLCTESGLTVTLVCVTDGQAGARCLLYDRSCLQLKDVRRRELLLSAWVLGIREVIFLEQEDSADVDWRQLDAIDRDAVIGRLERVMRQSTPRLILTHGPLGGYGHSAHRSVHACVMAAARNSDFAGSIFSFCGKSQGAFFSWHFDQPSTICVDARNFDRRRAASLNYHQTQSEYFLSPYFPRTFRKTASALCGYAMAWTEWGRKRVPIGTAERFFMKYPVEGLVLQQPPAGGRPHFFLEQFPGDKRIQGTGGAIAPRSKTT